MGFTQTLHDELDNKYECMLTGQTMQPLSNSSIEGCQTFEKKNVRYHERIEQEYSAFNSAVREIRSRRDRRISSENNAIEREAERRAHNKYVCAKIFKTIAFLLPTLISILVGVDIFSNRSTYELVANYGGVITGWVFFTLISLVGSVFAIVKLYTKEIYHNRNKIDNTKTYKIASICAVVLVAVICFSNFGTYIKLSVDEANYLTARINELPSSDVIDYAEYDEELAQTYATYNAMDFWQKPLVENRDRLLEIIPRYNQYKVENVKTSMALITLDSVSNDNILSNAVDLYVKLTDEQIELLSKEEKSQFDTYATVYRVVNRLNEINDDIIDQYNTIDNIISVYSSIDDQYKPYVYNYSLVAGFEAHYDYISSFQFEKIENGYSVGLKDGAQIVGELSIPERYKSELVTVIRDSAFVNDSAITKVIVPDGVSQIGLGAFQGCNNIQEMTLPFTGKSNDATAYEAVFGYIFGYTTKTYYDGSGSTNTTFVNKQYNSVSGAIWQYTCHNVKYYYQSYFYNIPSTIKTVTITNQQIVPLAAFNGCNMLTNITYSRGISSRGDYAFQNCSATIL